MANSKNWFKFYKNIKSKKLRIKSVELALKTNSNSGQIVDIADKIYRYIDNGL